MEHSVKIVIGANYGDEGKGLMSRYFAKQYINDGSTPVTVFHNGSAQRGHTVDYEDGTRHVFHNFAAGAKDGSITYYDQTFMVHPMDFCRELKTLGFRPIVYCNPDSIVVTPADMLADHIIEDYIAEKSGAREYGSCGYGTWSTTDRIKERPDLAYTVRDFATGEYRKICSSINEWVVSRIRAFSVDLELIPHWKKYFEPDSELIRNMWIHFHHDMKMFLGYVKFTSFKTVWSLFDSIIFEGAQGLLLDKDRDDIWTTTAKTGLYNPYMTLEENARDDFAAEVCYVSRSYVTRHGDGPLRNEVSKDKLGDVLSDQTNVFNEFQGNLRYATLSKNDVAGAIAKDFNIIEHGPYYLTTAYTHCNECDVYGGDYSSYSPMDVCDNRRKET